MSNLPPLADDIKVFFANKKRRNIFIFCILLLLLTLIVSKRAYHELTKKEPTIARILICPRCDFKTVEEIQSIGKRQCPKCEARFGYGWKCNKCDYEFSVKKMMLSGKLNKELVLMRRAETKCPNCDSEDTTPISTKK